MPPPSAAAGARAILGVPVRVLGMNALIGLFGSPLLLMALFTSWDALLRGLLFAAGIAVVGLGIHVGHGVTAGKTMRGTG